MRPDSAESKGERALLDLAELARGHVAPPTPARLEHGFRALSARVTAARAGRTAVVRWSIAAVAAAAILVFARVASRAPAPMPAPTLAYRVQGGTVADGGFLREAGGAGVRVSFTGGTEVVLASGTRGRLREVGGAGARIAIEHGTASFDVVPSPDRRWLVDVGPFLVTVKGTAFTVSWDVATELFELTLRRGRVTVSGPMSGGDITLQSGRRMVVDLPKAETLITALRPDEPDAANGSASPRPPSERPPSPAERPAPRAGAAAPTAGAKRPGGHHWTEALAAGRIDEILAEVDRTGVKPTLEAASEDDLLALADAARYRRRTSLARDALLAERRRFAGAARALDTAFLLGRVEEASDPGMARAAEWYGEYLARAPNGTYAAEALGRKMILTRKLEGSARARPVADEYLRRFPNGAYAATARALQRAP